MLCSNCIQEIAEHGVKGAVAEEGTFPWAQIQMLDGKVVEYPGGYKIRLKGKQFQYWFSTATNQGTWHSFDEFSGDYLLRNDWRIAEE